MCVGKSATGVGAPVILTSSRNHSFSSDKDLAVGCLRDEWSIEISSVLREWRHRAGHGGEGEPPVVLCRPQQKCF